MPISLRNTLLCLTLLLLAGFAWLQPVGYLASGLIGAVGARMVAERAVAGQFPPDIAVKVLQIAVIGFCILLMVGRHYGLWTE